MTPLVLSVITLLSNALPHAATPIAYAITTPRVTIQPDCAGAGCMGEDPALGCRSSGLTTPNCVGAGCMGN